MFKWQTITKHFDGHENGYNLELSHEDAFYPVVDGCEYHYVRFTESGEVYGATEDFMYISDNVTALYHEKGLDTMQIYQGLKMVDDMKGFIIEDITDEFQAFHDDPSY